MKKGVGGCMLFFRSFDLYLVLLGLDVARGQISSPKKFPKMFRFSSRENFFCENPLKKVHVLRRIRCSTGVSEVIQQIPVGSFHDPLNHSFTIS